MVEEKKTKNSDDSKKSLEGRLDTKEKEIKISKAKTSSAEMIKKIKTPASRRKKKENITDEELKAIFEKVKDKSRALRKLTDKLHDGFSNVTGMTPKALGQYIENPQNFSSKQWEEIQKTKRQHEKELKKLYSAVGLDFEKEKEKEEKKKAQKKRRKQLGMKKKNWIPIK